MFIHTEATRSWLQQMVNVCVRKTAFFYSSNLRLLTDNLKIDLEVTSRVKYNVFMLIDVSHIIDNQKLFMSHIYINGVFNVIPCEILLSHHWNNLKFKNCFRYAWHLLWRSFALLDVELNGRPPVLSRRRNPGSLPVFCRWFVACLEDFTWRFDDFGYVDVYCSLLRNWALTF